MTRKDYELLAAVFKRYTDADKAGDAATGHQEQSEADKARQSRLKALALALSDSLKQDNPRFNAETFLKACGI